MVTVTSRFRVANGMEEAVALAFRERPHLVESAPGFLGMDVVREVEDSTRFQLITRWSDLESYQNWHGSDAHRASHCGVPKGLRLDPAFTRVDVLDTAGPPVGQLRLGLLLQFLAKAMNVYCLEFDANFHLTDCNEAFVRAMNSSRADLLAIPLDSLLVTGEGLRLKSELHARGSVNGMLNFVDRRMSPFSVLASAVVSETECILIAEPAREPVSTITENMLLLQNELTRLNRETAQKNRELAAANEKAERALQDLENSFWHLRKIQEMLPICMACHKVKTTDTNWEDIVDYLQKNSLFLTHGLCPECGEKWK